MGVTGLHIGLQGKTNNKNTPKMKELGIQCEYYYWGLRTMKPNTTSRKSVRERKAAPDMWELAWHAQVGLARLLFDINGFTERWPLISSLWLWWMETKIRIFCNQVWTETPTWTLPKPQKWPGDWHILAVPYPEQTHMSLDLPPNRLAQAQVLSNTLLLRSLPPPHPPAQVPPGVLSPML